MWTKTADEILTKANRKSLQTHDTRRTTIHCHMLRKTKAMDLYQHGIPLPIIMRLLGHENASTTAAAAAATPTSSDPAGQPLAEDTLQALYSLR